MARARTLLPTIALLSVAAACGGGSEQVVRPPASVPPTSSTPTAAAPSALSPSTTAGPPRHPVAVVQPAAGLVEGQRVTVTGRGFSPGLALVVVQCLNRGTATGSADCNLSQLVNAQADASGRVTAHLLVSKGPYGTPPLQCSSAHPCLVSITEAKLQPTEEADAPISFR